MNTPFLLFLGDLGGGEIMLILVVILIFFGANKIPELARGLGKGIREFKDASSEIRSEIESGQACQIRRLNRKLLLTPLLPTKRLLSPWNTLTSLLCRRWSQRLKQLLRRPWTVELPPSRRPSGPASTSHTNLIALIP